MIAINRFCRWIVLVGVLAAVFTASAQTLPVLDYGVSFFDTVSVEAPTRNYTFEAQQGQLVTVQVMGVSQFMYPTLSITGPDQLLISESGTDPFDLSGRSARVTFRAVQTGTYNVTVGGSPGDFVISLDAIGSQPVALTMGQPNPVTIAAGADIQYYTFSADPTGTTALTVISQGSVDFLLRLNDPTGRLVTVIHGGVPSACLTVSAGSGTYELSIVQFDRNIEGRYDIIAAPGNCAGGGTPAAPAETPEVNEGTSGVSIPGVCAASSTTNTNIRSGPGTTFSIAGTLFAGQPIAVTSRTDNGWYVVSRPGLTGYIAQNVVTVTGPCANLPVVAGAQGITATAPTASPSATYTASATSATQTVTATYTSTLEADQTPTATYTYTYTYTPTDTPTDTPTYTPSWTPTQENGADTNGG